jgi:hypothetical protein
VDQAVHQARLANQSKTIRLPVHLVDKISKMRKVATALTEEFGREPTEEEVAIEMQIPVNKIAHMKTVSVRPASLDAPINDEEGGSPFGEIVGDENAISPYDSLREKNIQGDLRELLDSLDEREARIIKLRFGIDGSNEMTLEEVGKLSTSPASASASSRTSPSPRCASPCIVSRPSAPRTTSRRSAASASAWPSSASSSPRKPAGRPLNPAAYRKQREAAFPVGTR